MTPWRLPVVQPFPWAALLHYLGPRTIPGAERIDAGHYERLGVARVGFDGDALTITPQGQQDRARLEARVRHLFRPTLDTAAIDRTLGRDADLAAAVRAQPGLRLPGSWSGFELAIRVVIGQQVTVTAARTLLRRVVQRCGGQLSPAALLRADTAALGMPQARIDTLGRVAVLANGVNFDATPWADLRPQLAALKGIGPWTLGYLDMRLGLLPDVFPAADVGLQLATGERNARRLGERAAAWAPHRSFAAMRLWQALDDDNDPTV